MLDEASSNSCNDNVVIEKIRVEVKPKQDDIDYDVEDESEQEEESLVPKLRLRRVSKTLLAHHTQMFPRSRV